MALRHTATYDSIEQYAADAIGAIDSGEYPKGLYRDWHGVDSVRELKGLARDGWSAEVAHATEIADSAVTSVESEIDSISFQSYLDVSGCEVNIDRYLAGEPENMLEYMPVTTPRNGRVITVCASISISGSVESGDIKRRGYGVAALVFALQHMGLNTELWADLTSSIGATAIRQRILVKGANDEVDPSRIMLAYAHPAMLRAMGLPAMHRMPPKLRKQFVNDGYGQPTNPIEDMPEGTIYLPCVRSAKGLPAPEAWLRSKLTELGFIN